MPIKNIGLVGSNIDTTIGINIPKVPQLVPVAKARKIATTNITAGRKLSRLPAAFSISPPTNWAEANRSLVIFLRLVAMVRIRIADVIDEKPSEIDSIDFSKLRDFLQTKYPIVRIRAMIDPIARATDESVLAKAFTKSW